MLILGGRCCRYQATGTACHNALRRPLVRTTTKPKWVLSAGVNTTDSLAATVCRGLNPHLSREHFSDMVTAIDEPKGVSRELRCGPASDSPVSARLAST